MSLRDLIEQRDDGWDLKKPIRQAVRILPVDRMEVIVPHQTLEGQYVIPFPISSDNHISVRQSEYFTHIILQNSYDVRSVESAIQVAEQVNPLYAAKPYDFLKKSPEQELLQGNW